MIGWQNGWLQQCNDYSAFPTQLEQLSQVVKFTSPLAGRKVRLVLSNLYGSRALIFDQVKISPSADFKESYPQTLRYQTKIVVPAGKKVYLDPCELEVRPGQNFYVWTASSHPQSYADFAVTYAPKFINGTYARKASYLPKLHDDYQKRKGWFCLEQFLVWTTDQPKVVEIAGDSLAEMGMVAEPLFEGFMKKAPGQYTFANTAISGSRLLADAPKKPQLYRTYGQSLLKREANKDFKADITFISIGENDLLLAALTHTKLPTLASLKAGFKQLFSPHVYITTLPKVALQPGISENEMNEIETMRGKLNAWLLKQENVIDGAKLLLDFKTNEPNQAYSFGDGLHINLLGGQKLATEWLNLLDA